jgi:hypothetical protein
MKGTCPKCGSNDLARPNIREKFKVAEGRGVGYIAKCQRCGFVFSAPWPRWAKGIGLVLGPVCVIVGVLMWFDKSTSGLTLLLPIPLGIVLTLVSVIQILKSKGKQ